MKYITKFEAEQRAKQLEMRWGFGVFEDDKDEGKAEKKNPPMPNNVARNLVASYIEDETFGEIEELVHKHLAKHVDKTGGVKDYDSSYTSDLYRDFERQIVMPTVHSLADLDNAEAEGYSPFNPKNWRNDDTAQVWSLIEMDDVVSDMWNTMKEEAEDGRSSSARLETREKMSKELRRLMEDYKDVGEALDKVLWDLTQKEEQGIAKDVWRNMVNILDERELPAMFDAVEKAMKTVSGMTVTSPNNMESFKKEANNFLTILDAYWSKEEAEDGRSSSARLETRELEIRELNGTVVEKFADFLMQNGGDDYQDLLDLRGNKIAIKKFIDRNVDGYNEENDDEIGKMGNNDYDEIFQQIRLKHAENTA